MSTEPLAPGERERLEIERIIRSGGYIGSHYRMEETVGRLLAALRREPAPLEREREVAEACARICEARADSLIQQKYSDGKAYRIGEAGEARKCATAIRGGWGAELRALSGEVAAPREEVLRGE